MWHRYRIIVILLLGQAAGSGCFWDKDMVDQPSAKPQEAIAPVEPDAVPTWGGETLPTPGSERELFAAKDAAAALTNPVPATRESVSRGADFYQTHCLVCHGEEGRGDGPVGEKFVDPTPVDLNEAHTQDQADGEIFFTITRGRVAMPFYRDALSPNERWDLVNFVRAQFGQESEENEP